MIAPAPDPETLLGRALFAAASAVLAVQIRADEQNLSPAAAARLAEADAEAAAAPVLALLLGHDRLRQVIARALAREAAVLVREGGDLLQPGIASMSRELHQ